MKLKKDFITQDFGKEQIMVGINDSSFAGLVRSNATAAFIINCLKTETTKEKIVDEMCDKYDAARSTIEEGVDEVLNKLKSIGALDE